MKTFLPPAEWRGSRSGLLAALTLAACGAKTDLHRDQKEGIERLPECLVEGATRPCESICGEGMESCYEGKWRFCNAEQPRPPKLDAIVRDFSSTHPDFEQEQSGFETGIVAFTLGADDKPVYTAPAFSITTSDREAFDTWYNDDEELNTSIPIEIELLPSPRDPDLFEYQNSAFFPIDGRGFGNEGRNHNFHFTLEVETAFRYVGGEIFSFTGDDDLWVFINRRLAIDLGGVHVSLTASVDLDEQAPLLGLREGEVYSLHLFFAERHTLDSNFNVRTTIAEFELCD